MKTATQDEIIGFTMPMKLLLPVSCCVSSWEKRTQVSSLEDSPPPHCRDGCQTCWTGPTNTHIIRTHKSEARNAWDAGTVP